MAEADPYARIEAALDRIDAALARPDGELTRLQRRHSRLRARVEDAVAALDLLAAEPTPLDGFEDDREDGDEDGRESDDLFEPSAREAD